MVERTSAAPTGSGQSALISLASRVRRSLRRERSPTLRYDLGTDRALRARQPQDLMVDVGVNGRLLDTSWFRWHEPLRRTQIRVFEPVRETFATRQDRTAGFKGMTLHDTSYLHLMMNQSHAKPSRARPETQRETGGEEDRDPAIPVYCDAIFPSAGGARRGASEPSGVRSPGGGEAQRG